MWGRASKSKERSRGMEEMQVPQMPEGIDDIRHHVEATIDQPSLGNAVSGTPAPEYQGSVVNIARMTKIDYWSPSRIGALLAGNSDWHPLFGTKGAHRSLFPRNKGK